MKTHLNSCVYGNILPYSYSARKRTRKKLWRIIIKQKLTLATDMIFGWNWRKRWEFKLMLKCKYQCHCECCSEIGTCIINEAGRHAAHNDTTHCCFLLCFVFCRITPNDIVYVLKVYKLSTQKQLSNLTGTIPLRTTHL